MIVHMLQHNKFSVEFEVPISIELSLNTGKFLPRCIKSRLKEYFITISKNEKIETFMPDNNVVILHIQTKKISDLNIFLNTSHVMLEIPLVLYSVKSTLFKYLKEQLKDVLVAVQISDTVFLHLYGIRKLVLKARLDAYKIFFKFLKINYDEDKNSLLINDVSSTYKIVDSYINNKESVFITINDLNVLNLDKPKYNSQTSEDQNSETKNEKKIFTKEFNFDEVIFKFCLYYYSNEIEDILSFNQCFLNISDDFKIRLCGNDFVQFKNCVNEIYNIYFDIVYCDLTFEPNYTSEIFLFKTHTNIHVIGSIDKIIEILCLERSRATVKLNTNKEFEEVLKNNKGQSKLHKIIKETNVNIKTHIFETWVEFEITGQSNKVARTLFLLKQEKPTQICFFIDEKDHKKLIGHGGKNIQKYMKKHSVYIKFMNEPERIKLGYTGNVIIKTPLKNAINLLKMKNEIVNSSNEKIEPNIISIIDFYNIKNKNYRQLYDYIALFNGNKKLRYFESNKSSYEINELLENQENILVKVLGTDKIFIKCWNDLNLKKVSVDDWTIKQDIGITIKDDKYPLRDSNGLNEEYEIIGKNLEELIQKYDIKNE